MAGRNQLRWAIFATSSTARKRLLPALSQSENNRASLVIGRDPAKVTMVQDEFGIEDGCIACDFDQYMDALASHSVDAVYISLPAAMHVEYTNGALRSRKHVLCEKPIFLTPSDIDETRSISEGLILAENFSYAQTDYFQTLLSVLERGEIGEVQAICTEFSFPAEERHKIRYSRSQAGGCLRDLGCYSLDLISRLTSGTLQPLDISCHPVPPAQVAWLDSGQVDAACSFGVSVGDVNSWTQSSFLSPPRQWITIHGSLGSVVAPKLFRQEGTTPLMLVIQDGQLREYRPHADQQEVNLLDRFYKCVKGDTDLLAPDWVHWQRRTSTMHNIQQIIEVQLGI